MSTHTTIINDCRDANAAGRQMARVGGLSNGSVSFIGVSSDIEASGNLMDTLDAYGDSSGVVLVNVAPRNGSSRKWGNGTPFGYFTYKNVLVVASIEGYTLSLIKAELRESSITVMDIPTVLAQLVLDGIVTQDMKDYITQTQFRSFDFVPRVPQWIAQGIQIPGETVSFTEFPDAVPCVWWVDCFGNCKTTLTRENISISDTGHATILGNDVPFYEHLKDVPDNAIALIQGSSGIGNRRFLELVVQGGRASEVLNLKTGDTL